MALSGGPTDEWDDIGRIATLPGSKRDVFRGGLYGNAGARNSGGCRNSPVIAAAWVVGARTAGSSD